MLVGTKNASSAFKIAFHNRHIAKWKVILQTSCWPSPVAASRKRDRRRTLAEKGEKRIARQCQLNLIHKSVLRPLYVVEHYTRASFLVEMQAEIVL